MEKELAQFLAEHIYGAVIAASMIGALMMWLANPQIKRLENVITKKEFEQIRSKCRTEIAEALNEGDELFTVFKLATSFMLKAIMQVCKEVSKDGLVCEKMEKEADEIMKKLLESGGRKIDV